jgi:polyisoprenoid-binding protein YceI
MYPRIAGLLSLALCSALAAEEASYTLDPEHTYPSFEADHAGLSKWRGKMDKTTGKLSFDKATGQGSIDVVIDMSSIDFGHARLNEWAKGRDFFDVEKYPQATYRGKFTGLTVQRPALVQGELTLHGITRPVQLTIKSFKCILHPFLKRDLCGADATATFNRDEFGLNAGKDHGFQMDVTLYIQVEAIADKSVADK